MDKPSSQETASVRHSGNLPGSLNEQPVVYSDKPLSEDDIKEIPSVSSLPEAQKPRRKKSVYAAIGGGVAALLVAGGAVFAVNASQAPDKAPTETSAPAPDNSVEPLPEETVAAPEPTIAAPEVPATAEYTFGISQEQVQPFLTESIEGFKIRPIEERVLLPLSKADDIEEFAETWGSVSTSPLDVLPSSLSVNNTPQEIVAWDAWMKRLAANTTQADGMTLDEDNARKTLLGTSASGELSYGYQAVSEFINKKLQSSIQADKLFIPEAMAASGSLPMPEAIGGTPVTTDENGRPSVDITMNDPATNEQVTRTYNYVTSTAGPSMWVQE